MSIRTLRLQDNLEAALRSNHPWVYKNHVTQTNFAMGEQVRVEAGSMARYGVFDSNSGIAIRIFGEDRITDDTIRTLVRAAVQHRSSYDFGNTDSHRLIHGESDFLPGIVVDRYGRYAIAKAYSESVRQFLPLIARTVGKQLKLRGVAERIDTQHGAELTALFGQLPPEELTITEHGLKMLVNTIHGQKTGLFLDQRDNRQYVQSIAEGARVLNLFSYTGGFSLAALAGRAKEVTSVDISRGALDIADRQVEINGFDSGRHQSAEMDLFTDFADFNWPELFDIVVVDPPSLANNKTQVQRATNAYRAINTNALRLVKPGGLLFTASCTAQITHDMLRTIVDSAFKVSGKSGELIRESRHAHDHPTRRHFPEGQYLSSLAFRVSQ